MDVTETFDDGHPALVDHFPGHPMAPGVLLIQRLVAHLEDRMGEGACTGMRRVRFLAPVLPETELTIKLGPGRPGETRAEIRVDDAPVVTAMLLHADTLTIG